MSKKWSRIFSLILFVLVVGFLLNEARGRQTGQVIQENSDLAGVEELAAEPAAPQTEFSFTATQAGQAALELVQSEVELTLKEYPFGTMVEGVNGLLADSGNFWALYQNGEFAQKGIADIILEAGETLELKYEEIVF
jgi:hypothetical protein